MGKTVVKKMLIVGLVVFATLAYWEAGIRVIGKTAFPLLRTDPDVGSIHVKNYDGYAWDALSARKNYIRTNSLGYIGDEMAIEKPTSTIRIAMLGDSGLAALQVDYYRNFVELLETTLNTSGVCGKTRFEVMNFGVGSAGTFTEYQTYKKKITPFDPDYVLVFFTADYDDNLLKAGFDLEHYGEGRRAVGLKEFLLKFELPKFVFHKLIANEIFINTLELIGILEGDRATVLPPKQSQDGLAEKMGEDSQYYTFTFEIFSKFSKLVTANGQHFAVVMVPSELTDYAKRGAWKDNPRMTKLIDFLSGEQIPVFNPADQLGEARARYGKCLSVDCSWHFNEEGHRAMAQILYQYTKDELLKNNALCPSR